MELKILDRFINHKCMSLSENTKKSYRSDVQLFLNDINKKKNINNETELLQSITNDDVEDWIAEKKGSAFTTLDRRIITLKKFFKYATINKKITQSNPFDGIDRIKPPKNIALAIKNNELNYKLKQRKTVLSLEEIKQLIDSTYIKGDRERSFKFTSTRDRFLLSLLFTTGLRIEEALNIELSQLEPCESGYMVENIPSKTGVLKRVPIANKTLEYYNEYIKERKQYKNGNVSDYLIINERGNKWTDHYVNDKITAILKKANIDKHITCHSFRCGFKTYSTAKGINSDIIATVGGWKNELSNQAETYLRNDGQLDKQIIEACNLL